jgi:glycosyltransferase involved in cell wall biosynthesis
LLSTTNQQLKKLSLILTEFPPKFGGMQTHAVEITKQLSKYYDVTVYTYKSVKLKKEANEFDATVDYTVKRILTRVAFFSNIQKLIAEIKKEKPDLVYSSTIYYGILSEFINIPIVCRSVGNDLLRPWIIYPFKLGSRLLENPLVESVFYYVKSKMNKPPTVDILLTKARVKLAKRCAKGATVILGNSAYTQSFFKKNKINHCEVLAGGVNAKQFEKPQDLDKTELRSSLNLNPNSYIIMTACRFVQKKGLDFLIASFSKLETEFKDIELIIIGDGPMKKKLLQLNTSEKVHFLGKKTAAEIPSYYWASDVFVLCSREVKNERTGYIDAETMGRVLCEANAASVPVIASDSGGISSIITNNDNGLMYETDNFEAFKQQFKRIYKNKELSSRLIENGKNKSTSDHDWSILLDEHLKVFNKLIN